MMVEHLKGGFEAADDDRLWRWLVRMAWRMRRKRITRQVKLIQTNDLRHAIHWNLQFSWSLHRSRYTTVLSSGVVRTPVTSPGPLSCHTTSRQAASRDPNRFLFHHFTPHSLPSLLHSFIHAPAVILPLSLSPAVSLNTSEIWILLLLLLSFYFPGYWSKERTNERTAKKNLKKW